MKPRPSTSARARAPARPIPSRVRLAVLGALSSASGAVAAATPATGLEGSAWQAVFGLAVVLGVIAGAAWLLRRFSQVVGGGSGPLNTLAVLAVGQKERIVLVQCADTWIVVGVAPGQVNALHTMARPEIPENGIPASADPVALNIPGIPAFKQWLEKAVKRNAH